MLIKALDLKEDLVERTRLIDKCLIGSEWRLETRLDIMLREDTGEELSSNSDK